MKAMKNVVDGKIVGKVNAEIYLEANGGFPEVGTFAEDKFIKSFYKQLDTEVLVDWCEVEGLEWKICEDNESINRMRICMAILYKHFPKQTKAKKQAKYASYTLEDLINLALGNSVLVEETDDERILRMRLIMSLRAHAIIE